MSAAASDVRRTGGARPASRWRALARTALILAGLVALAGRLGTGAVLDALRALDPVTLLGALALGVVTTTASATRWCVVARGLGTPVALSRAVTDVYRATMLNSLLPAGVLGDVARAVDHGRAGGRAVVIERVAGQTVVVVTCAALLGVVGSATVPVGVVAGVLGVAGLAGLVGLAVTRLGRGPRSRRARLASVALARDVRAGVFAARVGPAVLVLSLVALAGYLALFVLAARAAGATLPPAALVGATAPALLAMSLPVGVGGFGPREAVAAATFAAAGAGAATGLAAALVYGVLALVSCLPGAAVLVVDLRSPGGRGATTRATPRRAASRWSTSAPASAPRARSWWSRPPAPTSSW